MTRSPENLVRAPIIEPWRGAGSMAISTPTSTCDRMIHFQNGYRIVIGTFKF